MKSFKLFLLAAICASFTVAASAQKLKTETFNVSGNCGMCETKIEKAAKDAGATYAEWNSETKSLTVKFKSTTSNLAKIQEGIAAVGYDNAGAKAKDETYQKLHGCCKYERATTSDAAKKDCCAGGDDKCTSEDHHKKDGTAKMDCCKDGKCTMAGHDGKDCCTKMDCCKDGKCTMPGHDGKDCCKKEN